MSQDPSQLLGDIANIKEKSINPEQKFNQAEHDSKSRMEITKLFLKWYFSLITGSFIFCFFYNYGVCLLNFYFPSASPGCSFPYIDVFNTVSIVTTTLSGGMGFVIGFYFKNKD